MRRDTIVAAIAGVAVVVTVAPSQQRPPIVDMRMHARVAVQRAGDGSVVGRPCEWIGGWPTSSMRVS